MKKKNILLAALAAGLLLVPTACEDNKDEFLSDFSTILYFRNSGELPVTIYKTGTTTDYSLTVNKSGSDLGAMTTATVTAMSEAALQAYNSSHGYNYRALPATCYTYTGGEVTFGASDLYKQVTVSMNPELIEENTGTDGTYVIPFEITNSTDSINADKRYAFIVPEVETPSIGFANTGYYQTDITSDGSVTVTQNIVMPIDNLWDFDCIVEIDQDLLDEYNASVYPDYTLLPPDSYSLEVGSFVSGSNTATLSLTIDRSQLGYGLYALPLRLTGASNENFEVNATSQTLILGINSTVERSELTQIPMSLDMMSVYGTESYYVDGSGVNGFFDGRGSGLHWHGSYSSAVCDAIYGQYIDFTLNEPMHHFAYNLWTRYENSSAAPVNTVIYVGNDGETWRCIGQVTNAFTAGDEEYDSGVFSSAESFTYVRFSVTESNAGNVCAGSYWNCGEMQIFGN